jgi:hypothetical protein
VVDKKPFGAPPVLLVCMCMSECVDEWGVWIYIKLKPASAARVQT